jgi:Ca2+-binding RTX toxin-like protein
MTYRFHGLHDDGFSNGSGDDASWSSVAFPLGPIGGHLSPLDVVNGNDGDNNSLFGSSGDDVIHGNGGDDGIYGGQGSDFLYGDAGNDAIFAGDQSSSQLATSDTADGGDGNDIIRAYVSTDAQLTGDAGSDQIYLSTFGNGTASGGDDNDTIQNNDVAAGSLVTLHGDAGDDSIGTGNFGSTGATINVYGDAGNDTLTIQVATANIYGGDGNDTIHASGIAAISIDGGAGDDYIELGSPFGPTNMAIAGLTGGTGSNTLQLDPSFNLTFDIASWSASGSGFQTLLLQDGTNNAVHIFAGTTPITLDFSGLAVSLVDTSKSIFDFSLSITGSDGNDTLTGADTVTNFLYGGLGNDMLTGGTGNDQLIGEDGDDVMHGGDGSDTLYADGASSANPGNDTLNGDGGNDTLYAAAGIDTLNGGAGNDTINGAAGGTVTIDGGDDNDTISVGNVTIVSITGGAGDDTIQISGATLHAGVLTGGAGTDTLDMGGSITLAMASFSAASTSMESLGLGRLYNSFSGDDTANALDFSGFVLANDGGADSLTKGVHVDGAGGNDVITGTALNDVITGGTGNDTINIANGGSDAVSGNDGDDTFNLGAGLDNSDTFDGGTGTDTVVLNGTYATQVTLQMIDVETVRLTAGHNYNLLVEDRATTGFAVGVTIDGSALSSHDAMTVFVTRIDGSPGGVTVLGGSGADSITVQGDATTVEGGRGNDTFQLAARLSSTTFDGGVGNDTLALNADYSANLAFSDTALTSVEAISVATGHSYNFTFNDGNVAAAHILTVDGSSLLSTDTLRADGSAETDGRFVFLGGAGGDTLIGGTGNDSFTGNDGNDTLDLSRGGNDTASGGAGDDMIVLGAGFNASDAIDGGTGNDTITLNGDYALGFDFHTVTISNIETIIVGAGFDYRFKLSDVNVAAGQTLSFDATALGSGNILNINGSHEQDGNFVFSVGAGDDQLIGGAGADTFNLQHGGNDHVTAGAGNDIINMAATLTADDRINGGPGSDTLTLNGDYSAGVTLTAIAIVDIDTLSLTAGHSYKFTTSDGTVTAGHTMVVDGSTLLATDALNLNGSHELDGKFTVTGGAGNDTLTGGAGNDVLDGGAGNDTFNLTFGGIDHVTGGDGDDTVSFGAAFTASDRFDGGAGNDKVTLTGDYSAGAVFTSASLLNVETLSLGAGFSYKLTSNNATVAAGQTMAIFGANLGATDSLTFNGAAETDGHFKIYAGAGADTLTGGGLSDIFVYSSAALSTGTLYDTIKSFNFNADQFDVTGKITAVDAAITSGALDAGANFNTELATAVGTAQLGAHHAVLFTASSGALSGQTFLIVDQNGTAGYQANADLVIHMSTATGTLSAADFI